MVQWEYIKGEINLVREVDGFSVGEIILELQGALSRQGENVKGIPERLNSKCKGLVAKENNNILRN